MARLIKEYGMVSVARHTLIDEEGVSRTTGWITSDQSEDFVVVTAEPNPDTLATPKEVEVDLSGPLSSVVVEADKSYFGGDYDDVGEMLQAPKLLANEVGDIPALLLLGKLKNPANIVTTYQQDEGND